MILTIENICQYLLESKLIDLKSIIEGDLLVRDVSSRNTNFLVNQFHENGLKILIKQPDITDEDYVKSMEVEAEIYRIIYTDSNFENIRQFLPHFKLYDAQNHILIIEQLTGVCRIFDYLYHGLNLPDENIISHFANGLAALHNLSIEKVTQYKLQKAYPWFLNIGHKSYQKNIKKNFPNVFLQLSDILENQEWMKSISKTQRHWQLTNFIHLDCRFTNWMIPFRHKATDNSPIWLIDWEMAGKGDAAWDITFLLGDWINFGIYLQEYHLNAFPYVEKTIAQQINLFWKKYAENRKFEKKAKKIFLKRLCEYLPIKILMIAYEMLIDYPEDVETPKKRLELFKQLMQNPSEIQQNYFYD
ncbi:phosphotransferase family protein [Emticicia sp.]|uniref:phosphotransferase family protein n=1 Tax=Emticicia sp. TaxID=1930953 RepID=UPI003751A36C